MSDLPAPQLCKGSRREVGWSYPATHDRDTMIWGLGTLIRASYKVRNLGWGGELKKIQNKGLTWAKIQSGRVLSWSYLSSNFCSVLLNVRTSWGWGKEEGDQPPPLCVLHFCTRILGPPLPSHRMVELAYRAGKVQGSPKVQAPDGGYGDPKEPAVSEGDGEQGAQDLTGCGGGQGEKRRRRRQVKAPWAPGLG